jgi:hypothetical protein
MVIVCDTEAEADKAIVTVVDAEGNPVALANMMSLVVLAEGLVKAREVDSPLVETKVPVAKLFP